MKSIDLSLQTVFTQLIELCLDASFDNDFDERGQFVKVRSKDRDYWYYQIYRDGGRKRKYVGPVSDPNITSRVEKFRDIKSDFTKRRELVRALTNVLPRPDALTGNLLEAFWKAGFFRLRGVLIGTVAFQAYAGLLGAKLPGTAVRTQDTDLAKFKAISDSVGDSIPPILEVLKSVDQSFRAAPQLDAGATHAFVNSERYRVEFLTPNMGSQDNAGKATGMASLGGAGAMPLRFLDFLLHEPVWSVLLHAGGVPVRVPSPARFAIHKLIVSTRRSGSSYAKADKDLMQAGILIELLSPRRSFELGEALVIAELTGPKWKQAIQQASGALGSEQKEMLDVARDAYRS